VYTTFGQCEGRRGGRCGDAQHAASARDSGKQWVTLTGANNSKPDVSSMDAPPYEALLQRIKRQENETAQLRRAYQEQLNITTGISKHPHRDNRLLVEYGQQSVPVPGRFNTQSRQDSQQFPQNVHVTGVNQSRQRLYRHDTRKVPAYSSSSSTDCSDDKSTSDSDRDIQRQSASGHGFRRASDNRRRSHRRRDRTRRRRRKREKSAWIKREKFNGHGCFETFLASLKTVVPIIAGPILTRLPICAGHSLGLQLNYSGKRKHFLMKNC